MIQQRIADTKEYYIKKSNIERNILLADTQEYTSF